MIDNKLLIGIIGVLGMLIGFGGSEYLDQDIITNAYICTTNENVGVFDRLSSTSKTGYYLDEDGVERRNVCRNGEWIPIIDYANSKGVDPNSFIRPVEVIEPVVNFPTGPGKVWKCDNVKCTRIK